MIPNRFRKTPLIDSINLYVIVLVTAQHSEPYRKMGGMQVLYNFSLMEMRFLTSRSRYMG